MIDSHCHLDFPRFDVDRDVLLKASVAVGMKAIVVPGVSYQSWSRVQALTDAHGMLFPAVGLHPQFLDQHRPEHIDYLADWSQRVGAIAIGEIGLDFYQADANRTAQMELFEAQLDVARSLKLPVILHVRKAHDPVLSLLRKNAVQGGIVHAFNGSQQQAEQYLALGFKLGFGGAMTYDRARHLHRLVTALPLSALVVETDAPDMAPAGHHGERNSPLYLPEIIAAMAALRSETAEQIAAQTMINCCDVLRLNLVDGP